jgi:hypothetical protein
MAEREGGPEWTRAGIVEIARASAADYLVHRRERHADADLKAMFEAGAMGTLKKIKFDPETGAIVEVEQHDRSRRLGLLAKMHGIAPDQTNVTFTTPQQQALGQMLRDPKALAMARQLAERMNGHAQGQNDHGKAEARQRGSERKAFDLDLIAAVAPELWRLEPHTFAERASGGRWRAWPYLQLIGRRRRRRQPRRRAADRQPAAGARQVELPLQVGAVLAAGPRARLARDHGQPRGGAGDGVGPGGPQRA